MNNRNTYHNKMHIHSFITWIYIARSDLDKTRHRHKIVTLWLHLLERLGVIEAAFSLRKSLKCQLGQ